MDVKEIVKEYLEENGYGGLADPYGECGCEIDDLMPCESDGIRECIPGYRVDCTCGEGCEFHIAIEKPDEA